MEDFNLDTEDEILIEPKQKKKKRKRTPLEKEKYEIPEIEVEDLGEISSLPEEMPAEKKESVVHEIISWVLSMAVAILISFIIKDYVMINASVPTGSMESTIMPGNHLIGNRMAYLKSNPQRGDIVIFYYPDDETQIYVKRVIGLPNETITIEDGKIYIGDSTTPLEENYLKEEWNVAAGPFSFQIPEDCYLMLGDNRNDSWDARYWTNTYVSKDKILGRASFIYWPITDFGKLK